MKYLVTAIGQNGKVERVITADSTEDAQRQFENQSSSKCFKGYCNRTGNPAWKDFTFKEI